MRAADNNYIQALDALAVKLASVTKEVELVRDYALRGDAELINWRKARMENHLREVTAIAKNKLGVDMEISTEQAERQARIAIAKARRDDKDLTREAACVIPIVDAVSTTQIPPSARQPREITH